MLLFASQWKYTICQWWYGKWRCSAWNRKNHLELSSLLFCCVCYGIYCDIISYVYRIVIQVCDIMYIYIYIHILFACIHVWYYFYIHTHTYLSCFSVCGFEDDSSFLVFAIAVCHTVWLGGTAPAVWKAVCLKGLWALWANERVQVDSGAMYRQKQGVCWGSFFFFSNGWPLG